MNIKIIAITLAFFTISNLIYGEIFVEFSTISQKDGIFYKLPVLNYVSKLCSLPVEIMNSLMNTSSSFTETKNNNESKKSDKARNTVSVIPVSISYEILNFVLGGIVSFFWDSFGTLTQGLVDPSIRCPPDFIRKLLCLFLLFLILRPRSSISYEAVISRKVFRPGL